MVTAVIDVIHCRGKDNHCLHAPIGGVRRCNKAAVKGTHQKRRRTPRAQETVDNLASRSALTCKANAMHRHVGPFSLLSVPNRLSIPCSVIDRGWFVSSESGLSQAGASSSQHVARTGLRGRGGSVLAPWKKPEIGGGLTFLIFRIL